ncbi:MAG: cutinase family protein [Mycobacterium sp.]|nr:cutinase family protein [Mycobacterium sp.]MBV8293312.1 cutinase family protein [Mycobacterium sp.]
MQLQRRGVAGSVDPARAGSCPDIQVVFARGTGEPSGPGRVGQAFVESLRSLTNGKSVAVYAVDYINGSVTQGDSEP